MVDFDSWGVVDNEAYFERQISSLEAQYDNLKTEYIKLKESFVDLNSRLPLQELSPKLLGTINVDSGSVWIGDPSYILHEEKLPSSLGESWDEFVGICLEESIKSFKHDAGHEGLGVCTSTKYGDGNYPVIGFFDLTSKSPERPSCVLIDFDNAWKNFKND